jgi:hypothetical protein
MMGDTSYFAVCNEECSIWYYSDRTSLTKADTDIMYPYEREMTLEMFKNYDEHIQQKQKEEENKRRGISTTSPW